MKTSRTEVTSQPAWASQPSTPRATTQATPMVSSGARAASGARYIRSRMTSTRITVTTVVRSVDDMTASM